MTERDQTDHKRAKDLLNAAASEPATVDIEAIYPLVESASEPARWNAAGTLGYASSDHADHVPTIVGHLQSLLDDDSDRVRARAVGSLGQIAEDHPAALTPVLDDIRAAYDDVVKVRRRVVHTLGYACRETPVEARQSVKYLRRALQDDDEIVRRHAKDGLARLTPPEAAPAENVDDDETGTGKAYGDTDDKLDLQADDPAALWTRITDETEPQSVRERSVDKLVSRVIDDPHDVRAVVDPAVLSALLTDVSPHLRKQITALLRELAADDLVRFASTDFDCDDKSTWGPSDQLLSALTTVLTDPNPEVRASVTELFQLLVEDGTTALAAPVVERFDQLKARIDDDVPAVREHAAAIAATLAAEESSVVAPARDLLRERLTDVEPAVREHAAAALVPLVLAAGDTAAVATVSHDADRHVSVGLARGFASVAKTTPHIAQAGIGAVLPLADTALPEARIRLLKGYEHVAIAAPEAVVSTVPLLEATLTDADAGVRHTAARTLTLVLASHPEASDWSLSDLLTDSKDIQVETVRASTGSTPRGQPSQSAVVDPVWMLWTLLQEPITQDEQSRTTELIAQIPADWIDNDTMPAPLRQQALKEIARIARVRPTAMTDVADTESIEHLLGTLLSDDNDRVAIHALRVHKRLWEGDNLGPPPGDDAGRLSVYIARSEVELQSMLTDAYPGVRADAAEVLAERLELQEYSEFDYEEVAKLIPHLQLCLDAPNNRVRVAAVDALRRIPSSFPLRPAEQPGMMLTTHPDLKAAETYELDTQQFVSALTDNLSTVREAAAELLTELLSPTELRTAGVTVEAAMELFDGESVNEQQRGVELLEQLAIESPTAVRPTVDALVAWLNDTDADARPAASTLILIARRYPGAVDLSAVYSHTTNARNLGARIGRTEISKDAVQEVVGQLQHLITVSSESTTLDEGISKTSQHFALDTVRGIAEYHPKGIKPAVDTLETHLADVGSYRQVAAGALAHYYVAAGDKASLRTLFCDDDEDVRKHVVDAMKHATGRRSAVIDAVEPLLVPPKATETDRRIQRTAVEIVRDVAAETPQAAVPLLEPLQQMRDADTEAHSAAEQVISRIETVNHNLSDFTECNENASGSDHRVESDNS